MSSTTYYERNRDVILNRAKHYYENNKELLRERAKNKYRELPENKKNIKNSTKKIDMSTEEKQKLKNVKKNYREARKTNIFNNS